MVPSPEGQQGGADGGILRGADHVGIMLEERGVVIGVQDHNVHGGDCRVDWVTPVSGLNQELDHVTIGDILQELVGEHRPYKWVWS